MASPAEFTRLHRVAQAGLTTDELVCMRNLALGGDMSQAELKSADVIADLLESAQAKLGAPNMFNAVALAALAGLIGKDVIGPRQAANDSSLRIDN